MRSRLWFLVLLSTLSFANEDNDDVFALDIEQLRHVSIITAARLPESPQQLSATVAVITAQDISLRGYRTLRDVLRELPGFVWHSEHNATVSDAPTWRGIYGGQKLLILLDGVRISSPAGEPETIADNYPLLGLARIEVMYGPASALYGADAFSGVINLISVDDQSTQTAALTGEFGDHHQLFSVVSPFAVGAAKLALEFFHRDSDPNLDEDYPDLYGLNDLRRFNGQLFEAAADRDAIASQRKTSVVSLKLTTPTGISAGWRAADQQQPTTIGSNPNNVNYDINPIWHTRHDTAWLHYQPFDTTSAHRPVLTLNAQRFDVRNDSFFANIIANYDPAWKYAKTDTVDLMMLDHFRWSEQQTISYGVGYGHINSILLTADLQTRYNPRAAVSNQQQFYLGSNNQLPVRLFDVSQQQKSAWLQHKAQWSPQWASTLGLRWDHNSDYGAVINPRLAVNWRQQEHSVRLSAGRAFLAPSPTTVWRHYGSFIGDSDNDGLYDSNFMFVPNPDLAPEKLRTAELAWRWQGDDMVMEARMYQSRVDDFINDAAMVEPDTSFVPGGEIHFSRHYDNVGRLRAHGGELTLRYAFMWQGWAFDTWTGLANADGELTLSGVDHDLPYHAKWSAQVGISARDDNWSAQLSAVAVASTSGLNSDDRNNDAPGYCVWRGLVRWQINRAWQAYMRIDNVWDQRYYHVTLTGGPFAFVAAPQPRRQVDIGLRWQW